MEFVKETLNELRKQTVVLDKLLNKQLIANVYQNPSASPVRLYTGVYQVSSGIGAGAGNNYFLVNINNVTLKRSFHMVRSRLNAYVINVGATQNNLVRFAQLDFANAQGSSDNASIGLEVGGSQPNFNKMVAYSGEGNIHQDLDIDLPLTFNLQLYGELQAGTTINALDNLLMRWEFDGYPTQK